MPDARGKVKLGAHGRCMFTTFGVCCMGIQITIAMSLCVFATWEIPVPLWYQAAGRREQGGLVVWDYHVILLQSKGDTSEGCGTATQSCCTQTATLARQVEPMAGARAKPLMTLLTAGKGRCLRSPLRRTHAATGLGPGLPSSVPLLADAVHSVRLPALRQLHAGSSTRQVNRLRGNQPSWDRITRCGCTPLQQGVAAHPCNKGWLHTLATRGGKTKNIAAAAATYGDGDDDDNGGDDGGDDGVTVMMIVAVFSSRAGAAWRQRSGCHAAPACCSIACNTCGRRCCVHTGGTGSYRRRRTSTSLPRIDTTCACQTANGAPHRPAGRRSRHALMAAPTTCRGVCTRHKCCVCVAFLPPVVETQHRKLSECPVALVPAPCPDVPMPWCLRFVLIS
eukprot:355635-Chlamydomonas_euryale.AAC.10